MIICNFIHLILIRNQVCKHYEMLTMNKFKIMKINSSIIMLQMLNNVIKTIAIFYLNNVNTENNV